MVVALVMVFFLGRGRMVNSAGMIAAAFAGAMLSMGFVLLMSRRIRRMSMLVVSGVMIGYICSAVTELVVTFAQDADIVNLHNWSLGSFSGTTWSSVRAACICVTVIFVLVFLMSKPLSAYQLGESYALNLGVNVRLLRIGMVVFSSILSACGLRRTDLLCRDRSPAAGQKNAGNRRTDLDDPGQLSGGQCFLPVL